MNNNPLKTQGILLIDKPAEKTSFHLVAVLRKLLGVQKIGHAGTLDPFATGVMVMLIGKPYTSMAEKLQCQDKAYRATAHLGIETDSYDIDGNIVSQSDHIPTLSEIEQALQSFQGTIDQLPPMFSAKKQEGKKLYELARAGITVERQPKRVTVKTTLVEYNYPNLVLDIECSKGTYIRSIAQDLGKILGCGAHLSKLIRTRSGPFSLDECISLPAKGSDVNLSDHLRCSL